jgi:Zinc finger, C2H2 type
VKYSAATETSLPFQRVIKLYNFLISVNPPIDTREPGPPTGADVLSPPPLQEAPREEGSSVFQCKVCGQIFTNQADLEEHMLSHDGSTQGKSADSVPAGVA